MELSTQDTLDREASHFYQHALALLQVAQVPFLVGGTFAFENYSGIVRKTKDLDLFVRPVDCERSLQVFRAAGYRTEIKFPHWLAKAFSGNHFIDIIFNSDNGIGIVDDDWFKHGVQQTILDIPVLLCPREEMIWTKAFIMERERHDGADVAHMLRGASADLDWSRLLRRFNPYWRVLLSHLVLFGFIYPNERTAIPGWLMRDLITRLGHEQWMPACTEKLCQGTLLSQAQYRPDIEQWGYRDARQHPFK